MSPSSPTPTSQPTPFQPPTYNYVRACREAEAKEHKLREAVFLGVPYEMLGLTVRLMTLDDLVKLVGIGSPCICGGEIEPAHIAQFLWLLSPDFSTDTAERDAFVSGIAGLNFQECKAEIEEYTEMIFLDSPGGKSTVRVSFVASAIDVFVSEYRWTTEQIMALPLPHIFQFLRAMALRKGTATGFGSKLHDRATKEFLEAMNDVPLEHRDAWHQAQLDELEAAS